MIILKELDLYVLNIIVQLTLTLGRKRLSIIK